MCSQPLFYHDDDKLDAWAEEAAKMGKTLELLARHESSRLFDKLIQASLDEGDGWIHKYLKNEAKQTPTICSDLLVSGLPNHNTNTIRAIFKDCREITRI